MVEKVIRSRSGAIHQAKRCKYTDQLDDQESNQNDVCCIVKLQLTIQVFEEQPPLDYDQRRDYEYGIRDEYVETTNDTVAKRGTTDR